MSCHSCHCSPCCCVPPQQCIPEDYGLIFPSLVGPPGPPGGPGTYAANYAALRALNPTSFVAGFPVVLGGGTTIHDGGEGTVEYVPTATDTDNGGTIFTPANGIGRYFRVYSGPLNVKWWGAKGDGATNDAVAIQAAIAVAIGVTSGLYTGNSNTLYFPPGVYCISATINVGTASGSLVGASHGLKLLGGGGQLGLSSSVAPGCVWLKWTGASGGGPMLLLRNINGTTVDGINIDGATLADTGLQITHGTGDQNAHNILVANCTFTRCQYANVMVGGLTADLCDADVVNLTFLRCNWTHGSYATRTHFRGTSSNALPIQFVGCEWTGNRQVSYHLELTGGMYSIHGGYSGGANVAAILYNVNPIAGVNQVPPNVCTYGYNSQGDRSFIRWDYSTARSSSAGLRPSVFNGLNYSSDGLAVDNDAIQWDAIHYDSLNLEGVFMNVGNINVVSATALVFVTGLVFAGIANNTFTGNTTRVAGSWHDLTVGVARWNNRGGFGGLLLGTPPSTLGTVPATTGLIKMILNGGTGKMQAWIQFPTGVDQLIATEP